MSSLTSLGINKNKKKFGPTLNKNKNRSRKITDSSSNQASSIPANSSLVSSSQIVSNKAPDETVSSVATFTEKIPEKKAFNVVTPSKNISGKPTSSIAAPNKGISKEATPGTATFSKNISEVAPNIAALSKGIFGESDPSTAKISKKISQEATYSTATSSKSSSIEAVSNKTSLVKENTIEAASSKISSAKALGQATSSLAALKKTASNDTPLVHNSNTQKQPLDNNSPSQEIDELTQEEMALNHSVSNRRFTNQPKVIPAPDLGESRQQTETNNTDIASSPEGHESKTTASLEPSEYPHTPGVMAALSPEYPHTPSATCTSPEYTATPHNNVASPEYTNTPHYCSSSPAYATVATPENTATPKPTSALLEYDSDDSSASLDITTVEETDTTDMSLSSSLPLKNILGESSSNTKTSIQHITTQPAVSNTQSGSPVSPFYGKSSHSESHIDIEGSYSNPPKEDTPLNFPREDTPSNSVIDIDGPYDDSDTVLFSNAEIESPATGKKEKKSKRKRKGATEDEASKRKRGRVPYKGKGVTFDSTQLKEILPKETTRKSKEKPKEKGKEKSKEKSREKSKEPAKAVAIGIGLPSSNTSSSSGAETGGSSTRQQKEKPAKKQPDDFRLPENLRTLADVPNPTGAEHSERPMSYFLRDIDGVVSKSFKELEMQRYEEIKQKAAIVNMSAEEQEEFQRKKSEEMEKKRKLLEEKKAEEEKRRKELASSVLQETSTAPQVRIVNGQIVLDTDSLTVERSQASQDFYDGAMEIVEENSMTKKINSLTYGKKGTSVRWSAVETDMFYELLSQFGTDFETISKMIPGRTRSHIRLKFNREEKLRPEKITDFLIRRRKKPDLNLFAEMANTDLEDVPADFNEMQLL
ncbi:hypothetical protein BY458DRAFT_586358 [Sporodiniella umbellata]|nr:hypothetical protein BY458DRAFT_586358 [Sporodiniella umbellata]